MAETFGNRLKMLRGTTSQVDFANSLSIPQATLSNYERDRNKPPLELVSRICLQFDVSAQWLLFGTGEMREKADLRKTTASTCPGCEVIKYASELDSIHKTEHEDLRELSREVRLLYQQNARLERENGDLREKIARLEGQSDNRT